MSPIAAPIRIAMMSPEICSLTPREAIFWSPRTVPTLAEMAGPISGATTIAPMMVAAESSNSPVVAMIVLRIKNAKNVEFAGAKSCARAKSSSREMRRPGNRASSAAMRWETTVSVERTMA